MDIIATTRQRTYSERIEALRAIKLRDTREKQNLIGAMDHDDWGTILPPEEIREFVQTIDGSGVAITDVRIKGVRIKSNHPSGGAFGPRINGENYRAFLEAHPAYVDPMCSLAGATMGNLLRYRTIGWNPDYSYAHLEKDQIKYQLKTGIGATQHFCQDVRIRLCLGFGGLLDKIRRYREMNGPEALDFYAGLGCVCKLSPYEDSA